MPDTLTPSVLDAFRTHAANGAWFSAADMQLVIAHIDTLTAAVRAKRDETHHQLAPSPFGRFGEKYEAELQGALGAYSAVLAILGEPTIPVGVSIVVTEDMMEDPTAPSSGSRSDPLD